MAKLYGMVAAGAALLAALTLGAGNAHAGLLGCRYPSSTQTFARWGDSSDYVPIPGGSFEGGPGWSLSGGAQIVDGNEPFYLGSTSDSHSLLLPPGSSALSPAVCVGILTPSFRFVGKSDDASAVHVTVYTRTLLGLAQLPISADVGVGTSWDASQKQQIVLQNLLGLLNLSRANVYFRFAPVGDATVQVDDVSLDPFFSR